MYNLGFPTDAIDTVKNLGEDATTQVRLTSGGSTQKYQLKEAPSKVMHALPSSSSSTWNLF